MNGIAAAVCVALILCFSGDAMRAAGAAAEVFTRGVLPALFPMMVLNQLMTSSPNDGPFKGSRVRAVSGTILFSFAAGSPASSQRACGLLDTGAVAREGIAPLLAATGVMSPMFFVGTLSGWTGLTAACWMMLLAHWAGALAVGGLLAAAARVRGRRSRDGLAKGAADMPPTGGAAAGNADARQSLLALLPGAVSSAAQALLAVCGSMMLFSIVAGVLRALLAAAFPAWTAARAAQLAIVWALLEIGGGSSAILAAYPAPPLCLLCALCSFGGLSIWLQNLLFVGTRIRPVKLLLIRVLHGVASYGLCYGAFRLFPGLAEAFAFMPAGGRLPWGPSPVMVAALILLAVPWNRRRRLRASS